MADNNSTLIILLKQVLSSELKNQIVTIEPPTNSANTFVAFVQTLENRRLYLIGSTGSGRNLIVPSLYTTIQNLNPINYTPAPSLNAITRSATSITTIPTENPIDLNSQKHTNKHKQKEYFHCKSIDHHIKDYLFPDNRSVQAKASFTNPAPLSPIPSSAQIQLYAISPYNLSPPDSPSSGNEACLV
ncbi:hypothetical protein OCU04_003959 [Sclerotinia nivalis]|uniref:Uncharacterized protein n=1 Tax=Sclerotinia nivalis TaxID=352851 RepID=A0A9X0AT32_9HELO|nr:hypothetical protein OCU04_003959 [Sclerotinia nivalis]